MSVQSMTLNSLLERFRKFKVGGNEIGSSTAFR